MDVMHYYMKPTPELVPAWLRGLVSHDNIDDASFGITNAAFLSCVMQANPEQLPAWFAELADLQGNARQIFHGAAAMADTPAARACLRAAGVDGDSPPDVYSVELEPMILDMLWACFFATGEVRPIRRIVSAFDHLSDRGAAEAYAASSQTEDDYRRAQNDALFQAASWSLGSLMQTHPRVLELCMKLVDDPTLTPNERITLAITIAKVAPDRLTVDIDPRTSTATITRTPPMR